jgi:hypothetical protein
VPGCELVRRSKRLRKPPKPAGGTLRSARKAHKDALCKGSSECGKSLNSSSEEWHSEEEKTYSSTDNDNDDERGNGDDEVSPVGVGKPPRGKQKPQVSVLTHYLDFLAC